MSQAPSFFSEKSDNSCVHIEHPLHELDCNAEKRAACDKCVLLTSSISECSSYGLDCACSVHMCEKPLPCKLCLAKGHHVAECTDIGLDCTCVPEQDDDYLYIPLKRNRVGIRGQGVPAWGCPLTPHTGTQYAIRLLMIPRQ